MPRAFREKEQGSARFDARADPQGAECLNPLLESKPPESSPGPRCFWALGPC